MCYDRLPPKLSLISDSLCQFGPNQSIAFSLYQEYNLFNENMILVRHHLENLEKYILYNTQIFPEEWKHIALTLQSQRVPDEWEITNCRPSTHTLKSWIESQFTRYRELKELAEKEFKGIRSLHAAILKLPSTLFSALLIQRSTEMKWNLTDCELCFEVREEDVLASEMKAKSKTKINFTN